jgi:hypothetical protein
MARLRLIIHPPRPPPPRNRNRARLRETMIPLKIFPSGKLESRKGKIRKFLVSK